MATPSRSLPPDVAAPRGGFAAGAGRVIDLVGRVREAGLLIALAAVVVIVGVQAPRYLSTGNIRQILVSVSIIAVVAVGQTLVVLTRNVDLSVASTIGLVAYVVRDLFRDNPDFPIWLAVIVCILIGACLGGVNGLLVTVGGVPAIVATLGTLYVFRGMTFAIGGGELVTASEVPPDFRQIALSRPFGIPTPILVAAAAALIVGYVLRTTRSGRQLYAVGSNPEAARLAGLPVDRLVFSAFVACGALAAVGGILWAARFPSVDARAATGYELLVVAAVVLGGVNIFGGSGTVLGAILGAIFLGMIQNALTILRLNAFWLQAISGAAILIAVTLDLLITRRLQEILRARRQR